jgi:hypothetical protein
MFDPNGIDKFVKRGHRWYRVPRVLSITDKIASRNTLPRSAWDAIEMTRAKNVRAHVCRNIK